MGFADFAQSEADEVKYKARLALTESKQRENWVWKLGQEMEQQQKKNQMTADMVNKLKQDTGLGADSGLDVNSPEVRIGEGGTNKVYYPSDKDKELRIKQGLNRINLKESKGMQLTPIEQKFKEEYSGLYDEKPKAGEPGGTPKGLSIETGGKLAMVKQAKGDIQEVRKMLFPDGTPKSFKRGLATASNIPGSRAPIIGAIIPQALPFHEGAQKIYSRLQNAVAAKLRVETGAQANPAEVENILARFGVTGTSNPEAAFDALNRLENFMDTTIDITDPNQLFSTAGKKTNLKELVSPIENNDLSLKIKQARDSGYSEEEIQSYIKSKGLQ
jgi:hypothetical protein